MDYTYRTRSMLSVEAPSGFNGRGTRTRTLHRTADCIFVTNRGPVEHHFDLDGQPQARRGAGGVVSGLLCAAQGRRVTWISLAMSEADRAAARQWGGDVFAMPGGMEGVAARLIPIPPATFRSHYDGFSNRVLWFLQHGMHTGLEHQAHAAELRACWERGYVAANAAVAEAVVAELQATGKDMPVIFHDYHLYLAPGMVRAHLPHARLQHFIHIPWPEVGVWRRLPPEMARRIYEGLAANDVVGFQTERDAHNFLEGAAYFLHGASHSGVASTLLWRGRRIHIGVYPIALSPTSVVAAAHSPEAEAAARAVLGRLGLERGRRLILRVDRVEPTKNIVQGFRAYERLLVAHPELRGQVVFLALLVPSREGLRAYQEYAVEVQETIKRINAKYGLEGWRPIVAVSGNNHERALACMRHYDVLLVNPLIDGMNLVAKEGGLVNERDGVMILSREAGAYAQLAGGVFDIDPRDVAATAEALYEALTLPSDERAALAKRVRDVLLRECADRWLDHQLADIASVTGSAPTDAALESELWVTPHLTAPLVGLEEFAVGLDDALEHLAPAGRPAPRPSIPLV